MTKPKIVGRATYGSSVPPHARASRQAYQALKQHARMFEALGTEALSDDGEAIVLSGKELTFSLGYRLQWKLLARVYHLRTRAEVAPPAPRATPPYRLDLRVLGLRGIARDLVATGPGAEVGRGTAGRLLASGLIDDLVSDVDLESLSIAWSADAGAWEVALEPYPGSHVRTLFPPMAYTVRLRETEVRAIRGFMVRISDVLRDGVEGRKRR